MTANENKIWIQVYASAAKGASGRTVRQPHLRGGADVAAMMQEADWVDRYCTQQADLAVQAFRLRVEGRKPREGRSLSSNRGLEERMPEGRNEEPTRTEREAYTRARRAGFLHEEAMRLVQHVYPRSTGG